MKKFTCLLFAAILLFGVAGGANAASYTLSYDTPTSPDHDLITVGEDDYNAGSALTSLTGSSTANSASIFDSAVFTLIVDESRTASLFQAWIDSARGKTPSYSVWGASAVTTTYPGEGTATHYLVTFNPFTTLAYFGNENTGGQHWYDNTIVMGIQYWKDGTNVSVDGAYLTVNYHQPQGDTTVPEPTTMLLLGLGLVGLAGVGRKFKK
jgi:hypothetical protein